MLFVQDRLHSRVQPAGRCCTFNYHELVAVVVAATSMWKCCASSGNFVVCILCLHRVL